MSTRAASARDSLRGGCVRGVRIGRSSEPPLAKHLRSWNCFHRSLRFRLLLWNSCGGTWCAAAAGVLSCPGGRLVSRPHFCGKTGRAGFREALSGSPTWISVGVFRWQVGLDFLRPCGAADLGVGSLYRALPLVRSFALCGTRRSDIGAGVVSSSGAASRSSVVCRFRSNATGMGPS